MIYLLLAQFLFAEPTVTSREVTGCFQKLFDARALPSEWRVIQGKGIKAKQTMLVPLSPDLSKGFYLMVDGKVQFCAGPKDLSASPLYLPDGFLVKRSRGSTFERAGLELSSQKNSAPLPFTGVKAECRPVQDPVNLQIQKELGSWLGEHLLSLNSQISGAKPLLTGAFNGCTLQGAFGDAIYKIADRYNAESRIQARPKSPRVEEKGGKK